MPSLFQILGVFLALVSSSYSLSCNRCTSASTSCTGTSMTCPSGSVCLAIYTQSISGGITNDFYGMSCATQDQCDMSGSISVPYGGRMKMGTSCCFTDNCTPTLPELPKDSSTSNGLTCRSCVSADSTWCYTSDTMQCTGNENMCILQTTKISGSTSVSTAIRGCATKTICDLGTLTQNNGGLTTTVKFICTNGSTGLQKGFFLSVPIVCLLLLKLLNSNV